MTKELQSLYEDLHRINGAIGYVLLMYLLKNRDELNIADDVADELTGGKKIFEKLSERLKKEYLSYSGGTDNFF